MPNHTPSAAILATTVEQIQKIVGICNKYKVPIWTISTGKNLGYGSAAPAERGQVVLDLHRMNRILEVDGDLCYALVEPGVTYRQLYDYFQEHKLALLALRAGALRHCRTDRQYVGPGGRLYALWRAFHECLRHGSGPGERRGLAHGHGIDAQLQYLAGLLSGAMVLTLDGIFTQSNYGIVTKFGFWLQPAPPVFKPFMIQYQNEEDMVEIVETMRPLRLNGVIPNSGVIAHALYEAPLKAKRSDYVTGPGSISDEAVRQPGEGS